MTGPFTDQNPYQSPQEAVVAELNERPQSPLSRPPYIAILWATIGPFVSYFFIRSVLRDQGWVSAKDDIAIFMVVVGAITLWIIAAMRSLHWIAWLGRK